MTQQLEDKAGMRKQKAIDKIIGMGPQTNALYQHAPGADRHGDAEGS